MGVMGHEAAFLRLVDKLTNGTQVNLPVVQQYGVLALAPEIHAGVPSFPCKFAKTKNCGDLASAATLESSDKQPRFGVCFNHTTTRPLCIVTPFPTCPGGPLMSVLSLFLALQVEINETGTTLRFKPGYITGGRASHDCGITRSLGWFIEGLLPLALFR